MATFKVISDRLQGMQPGEMVNEADFAKGVNVSALVQGGHLEPTGTKTSKIEDKPQIKEKL